MNNQLWNNILKFEFDNATDEYGFLIRLAKENNWTREFANLAVLEYKKFMYLAATSSKMVSPSPIVDVVWHQHLIFTKSYQNLCEVLGKQIQHIPSTHNKKEAKTFKDAQQVTKELYQKNFGEQPHAIWKEEDMLDSLNLKTAGIEIRTFVYIGIIGQLLLLVPSYVLLMPIYKSIDNPYFLNYYILIVIGVIIILELYNRFKLRQLVRGFDSTSFVYLLQPLELIYLQTGKLYTVINGVVNELIKNRTIDVDSKHKIRVSNKKEMNSLEEIQTVDTLEDLGETYYPRLLEKLMRKPLFKNIESSMTAFKKQLTSSTKFVMLFATNFIVFAVLLLMGLTRLVGGIANEKPVGFILITLIVFIITMFVYLRGLMDFTFRKTIPSLYKKEILPTIKESTKNDWQWAYFILGAAVLTPSFVPITRYVDKNNNHNGGSCGSGCGSSCGGGGCGGGCGGCGGCGG